MLARVLITAIGVAFVLWGMLLPILGIAGQRGTAVIETVRREMGERNESLVNRYTLNIGYTFTPPGRGPVSGFSRRVGSPVYVKPNGTATAPVRYFAFFPYLNALEEDTAPNRWHLLQVGAGIFLILVMRPRKQGPRRAATGRRKGS
jgi:hypothetical protein